MAAVKRDLLVVSYNLHGYNQGLPMVLDIINSKQPDVFLLQEHWLGSDSLHRFSDNCKGYFTFGSSAMDNCLQSGPLRGRPFGGLITLIHNSLCSLVETIHASERYVIIKVKDILLVNVYLACVGTPDRHNINCVIFDEIAVIINQYPTCKLVIGGDLNVDLNSRTSDITAHGLHQFLEDFNLVRLDVQFNKMGIYTYVNASLNNRSCLDYFLASESIVSTSYDVIDKGNNLSDHLPICASFDVGVLDVTSLAISSANRCSGPPQLRWDKADLASYYLNTGRCFQDLLNEMKSVPRHNVDYCKLVNIWYDRIVSILRNAAKQFVPNCKRNFYHAWWDQDMEMLKDKSIETHKLWKEAGRPKCGPIFSMYMTARLNYKHGIRCRKRDELTSYSDELHTALMNKQMQDFWKIWRAKFGKGSARECLVDGTADEVIIANKFLNHFVESKSSQSVSDYLESKSLYVRKRKSYVGVAYGDDFVFDVELLSNVVAMLKRGKAADLDELTAEHLLYSHPAVISVLTRYFNLIMENGMVPLGFGRSYIVPIPKQGVSQSRGKITIDDFRGITISSIISKIFEHCILKNYNQFFNTSANQFGYKKGIGCADAIYNVRCVVDYFTNNGSTVNVCAMDLSKAFDRVNHHLMFIKLMDRKIPVNLLSVLEHWLSVCSSCVRWGEIMTNFCSICSGTRQGGVLSPFLFVLYIDNVVHKVCSSGIGCFIGLSCVSIFIYADDVILLAPSVNALQQLVSLCEREFESLDMILNARKTICMRIGPRYQHACCGIVTISGNVLAWAKEIKYLGVKIVSSQHFKCDFAHARQSLFASFNAMYSKIGGYARETVVLELFSLKCLPKAVYGLEACPLTCRDKSSLNFAITRIFMKILRTGSRHVVDECMSAFGIESIDNIILKRKLNFLRKVVDNQSCWTVVNMATAELAELENARPL